jgi:hypothetical protein
MTLDQTAGTLDALDLARARTRSVLDRGWFAFVVWGVVVLVSAPVQLWFADPAIGGYWMVAAIGAAVITTRWFMAQSVADGIEPRHRTLYLVMLIAIMIGCFATGAAGGGGTLTAVGPPLVLSLGLLVLALVDRDPAVAFSATLIAAGTIAIWAIGPTEMPFWSALFEGTVLLATGIWCRARAIAVA